MLALAGAYVAWRQLQETRRHQQQDEALTREGQVTERFTRAVEQLGSDKLELRLGGIYALERIANDSPPDQAAIAEILSAYVRNRVPWPPSEAGQFIKDAPLDKVPSLRARAADVQAAMTVLTVLGKAQQRAGLKPLRLPSVDLRKADLAEGGAAGGRPAGGRPLSKVDLQGPNLQGANLQGASLPKKADLREKDLREADLQGADLQGAKLQGADLRGANLWKAKLRKADLQDAKLQGALLYEADLQEADLQEAQADAKTVWPDGFDEDQRRQAGIHTAS